MEEERNLRVRFKEETINDNSSVEEVTMVRYTLFRFVTQSNEQSLWWMCWQRQNGIDKGPSSDFASNITII